MTMLLSIRKENVTLDVTYSYCLSLISNDVYIASAKTIDYRVIYTLRLLNIFSILRNLSSYINEALRGDKSLQRISLHLPAVIGISEHVFSES